MAAQGEADNKNGNAAGGVAVYMAEGTASHADIES